jgi:NDP-sugar pyrophosphorylase family protein
MTATGIPRHAIILAAGMGSRLGPLTQDRPKPLVKVLGTPIILNALSHLERAGVALVTIVVGYRGDDIRQRVGKRLGRLSVRYIHSEAHASSGSAWSLWLARDALLEGDVLLLEGDVFFEAAILDRLSKAPRFDVAAVAPFEAGMQGSAVILAPNKQIVELRTAQTGGDIGRDDQALFKTINLYRLSAETIAKKLVPLLDRCAAEGEAGLFLEQVLQRLIAMGGIDLHAVNCGDCKWVEIDTVEDLRTAQVLFAGQPPAPSQEWAR